MDPEVVNMIKNISKALNYFEEIVKQELAELYQVTVDQEQLVFFIWKNNKKDYNVNLYAV